VPRGYPTKLVIFLKNGRETTGSRPELGERPGDDEHKIRAGAGGQQLRACQLIAARKVGATLRRGSAKETQNIDSTLRIGGVVPLAAAGTSLVKAGPILASLRACSCR